MNMMPAADSRFLMYGQVEVYEIHYRFEYRISCQQQICDFYVWAYGWCIRSNIDLNIEMNFMPAADSRFFIYGLMDSIGDRI